jgi:hypothetical protein
MSSGFSYLDNQNKKYIKQVTVPAYTASTTSFMVTIYPWPSFACLNKVTLRTSAAPGSASTALTVLNNGAAWRVGSGTSNKAPYILGTATANVANNIAEFSFSNGVYVEDAYRTNCLYLNINNSTFATGDTFTVTAEGTQMAPTHIIDNDQTAFIGDYSWRILRVDAAGECTDLTQKLMRNGNPYGIGSTLNNSESFMSFDTASDVIYIGSTRQFNGAMFLVPDSSQNNTRATFSVCTGIGFTTTNNIQDNTTAGMSTTSSFSYSGVIKVTSWAGAGTSGLTFDPLYALKSSMDNMSNNVPRTNLYHPNRYWLRVTFASITPSDLKLVGILPIR